MAFLLISFAILVLGCFEVGAINLECEFSTTSWNVISGTKCFVKNLIVTSPGQQISSINGQSTSYYQSHEVKILDIFSQTVHYMPSGIEKFFPKIEGIQIRNSKLKVIEKSDLAPFVGLKELHLQGNDLETLKSNLFDDNLDLQVITLSSNKLKFIGENILSKLTKLYHANFNINTCISQYASTQAEIPQLIADLKVKCPPSVETKQVKDLKQQISDLEARNKVDATEIIALKSKLRSCQGNFNAALKNLFLYQNQQNVEAQKIDLTCKIEDENCEVDNLKIRFPKTSIHQVKGQDGKIISTDKLKKLTTIDQQTIFLPLNLGHHFPELTELSVIDSGLFEVNSQNFKGLNHLKNLTLRNNNFIRIHSETFKDVEGLEMLDLSHNLIESVDNNAFKGLASLKELRLNENSLSSVNVKTFADLKNIKALNLQNNQLNAINPNLFSQLTQLSSADFTNNVCINSSFPQDTKEQIIQKIIDDCIKPILINCHFVDDEISLDDQTTVDGYSCKVYDLFIEVPNTKILKVLGEHEDEHGISNVTSFISLDQSIKFIPSQLASHFPEVTKVVIERSSLSSISKNDFDGFGSVQMISLRFNNLTTIEVESFDNLTSLEYLDLGHNSISVLSAKLFAKLTNLKTLILSHNRLETLSANIISNKNAIADFKFNGNQLNVVDLKILKFLRKNAKLIDFTDNVCIDLLYQQNQKDGTTFNVLFMEISMSCTPDDDE